MQDKAKKAPANEREAHWLAYSNDIYMLDVDGKLSAIIDIKSNLLQVFGREPLSAQLPYSVSPIEAAEKHLGLSEVKELILAGGHRAPDDWRAPFVEKAKDFGAKHTPESEARLYIGQALENLKQLEQAGGLVAEAQALRQHIRAAVAALDGDRADRVPAALHHLKEGDRSIERELSPEPPVASMALDLCQRAAACLQMAAESARAKTTGNGFEQALKKAAEQEADRGQQREHDRDKDRSR